VPRVLLFDIDNTSSIPAARQPGDGPGVEQLYGVPNGFAGIEFSGRTDRFILESGLGTTDTGGCEEHLEDSARYYGCFRCDAGARRHLMPAFLNS
jgi:hypothetical protein